MQRAREQTILRYVLLLASCLACNPSDKPAGIIPPSTPSAAAPVVGPVSMVENFLSIRLGITHSAPLVIICDSILAGRLPQSTQDAWIKSLHIADSIVLDRKCPRIAGEMRGDVFRSVLRITRVVTIPTDSAMVEADALIGFGNRHKEQAQWYGAPGGKLRIVFSDFLVTD